MKKTDPLPHPPKAALRFLAWFCPPELHEGIEGDLRETFEQDLQKTADNPRGSDDYRISRARRRFVWNVIKFFRPGIFLRNKFSISLIPTIMIKNYFKVASRNIWKRKLYSTINVFGLSIGMSFCILIYLFIRDEHSFDLFHVHKDRIYRIESVNYSQEKASKGETPYHYSSVQAPLAPILKDELPAVECATRISKESGIVQYGNKVFNEQFTCVDADFFRMFSFHLLAGNPDKIFQTAQEVVITPAIAEKYFGQENPLGETISIQGETESSFTVTGIIQAPPGNSSLDFSILLPLQSQESLKRNSDNWGGFRYATFVQLREDANLQHFRENLDRIVQEHMADRIALWKANFKPPADVKIFQYRATPLPDIYFKNEVRGSSDRVSDPQYSWILGGIAILILVVACINYISLALTSSAGRSAEVGIRKVVGAYRKQLIAQFSLESILLAVISMVIGMALTMFFLPSFDEFTGKTIRFNTSWLPVCGFALGLAIVIGILAGSYPALYLSRFRPALILKGKSALRVKAGFTKPLVVLQFALSFFLVISAVIMMRQMHFIADKDLGYNSDMILVIPTQAWNEEEAVRTADQLQAALQRESAVLSTTRTNNSFNRGRSVYAAERYLVDPYYLETLGLEIIQGRNFDVNNPADKKKTAIVNESLVKAMEWEDPLGQYIDSSRVIGVVRDYHYRSLEHPVDPMMLTMETSEYEIPRYILVKIQKTDVPTTIDRIKSIWTTIAPNKPFEYSFIDQDVAMQYQSYQRWTKIITFSTIFAILIASLGLFGLTGINTTNRTKEIGIRKAFGASLMHIFIMINKPYIRFAVIAFIVAVPFSYYMMNEWLANFQFKVALSWPLFAGSMMIGLLVALLTVSYHGIKAALVNPADTLKYE